MVTKSLDKIGNKKEEAESLGHADNKQRSCQFYRYSETHFIYSFGFSFLLQFISHRTWKRLKTFVPLLCEIVKMNFILLSIS